MTPKDMESQDGFWTDKEITEKEKIYKLLPTFCKPSWERISKECIKLDATRVLDTNGDLKLEVSTPKPQEEEERLSVSKKRKNDS